MGHIEEVKIWIGSKKPNHSWSGWKVEASGKRGISKSWSEIFKEFDLEVWESLLDFCRYCLWICRNTSIRTDREENGPV